MTQEYHRTVHSEPGCTPLERYLAGPNVGRECPHSDVLREAFRIELKRQQRRSDGTVRLDGPRLEIPSRYRHLTEVHLRYAIHHPQSSVSDFYRELGEIFGIAIRVSNRWGGFKALPARWIDHLCSANRRPIILIDEAQEMSPAVLCELRLLASARFDSQSLLCVVLAGDARLLEKLRREELIPLGSRIRTRPGHRNRHS